MGEQGADLALRERVHARVVPQQLEQAAQPQVRQPQERGGRRQVRCGVRDLTGLDERAARVPRAADHRARGDDEPVGVDVRQPSLDAAPHLLGEQRQHVDVALAR